uniref:Uncharacterized protein n=1 Tax=Rhizophora mucronata TaxID=61149 RepID=A0A2P2KCF5_RHIMU
MHIDGKRLSGKTKFLVYICEAFAYTFSSINSPNCFIERFDPANYLPMQIWCSQISLFYMILKTK